MEWEVIVSGVLVVLSVVLAFRLSNAKSVLKELAEALTTLSDALDDNEITLLELQAIRREVYDVILAGKKLIGR